MTTCEAETSGTTSSGEWEQHAPYVSRRASASHSSTCCGQHSTALARSRRASSSSDRSTSACGHREGRKQSIVTRPSARRRGGCAGGGGEPAARLPEADGGGDCLESLSEHALLPHVVLRLRGTPGQGRTCFSSAARFLTAASSPLRQRQWSTAPEPLLGACVPSEEAHAPAPAARPASTA